MSSFDTQEGGKHYLKFKIQPLEFIIANGLDFVQGNVIKYVCRYKDKGGIEDLKKARDYIDKLIETLQKRREVLDEREREAATRTEDCRVYGSYGGTC